MPTYRETLYYSDPRCYSWHEIACETQVFGTGDEDLDELIGTKACSICSDTNDEWLRKGGFGDRHRGLTVQKRVYKTYEFLGRTTTTQLNNSDSLSIIHNIFITPSYPSKS